MSWNQPASVLSKSGAFATRCHWCFVSCFSGSAEQGSFGVQQETAAMGASLAVRFWETLVVGHAATAGETAGG